MNLQELATAAEEDVEVKIGSSTTAISAWCAKQQQLFYGGRYHASRFHAEPDFAAIARGFGVAAVDLGRAADPLEQLARALKTSGPYLINVPIAAEANVYPMVPPGAANRDMIDGGIDAPLAS